MRGAINTLAEIYLIPPKYTVSGAMEGIRCPARPVSGGCQSRSQIEETVARPSVPVAAILGAHPMPRLLSGRPDGGAPAIRHSGASYRCSPEDYGDDVATLVAVASDPPLERQPWLPASEGEGDAIGVHRDAPSLAGEPYTLDLGSRDDTAA
jgi:hypothetical protein